jgi:Flp pilus assembly protein CpaB
MKSGSKLFIFTGVALALVTVLLAITMTSSPKKGDAEDTAAKPTKMKVVKAAADFEPHKIIGMSDILVEEMSSDQVPADAATDTALVLGQAYKLGAVKGDILLNTYLEAPGITNSIEQGKRAISVAVDAQGMMSGLIMDGDYVDVVFDARVDLRRVLDVYGIQVVEDGLFELDLKTDNNNDSGNTGDSNNNSGDSNNSDKGSNIPDIVGGGIASSPYQGNDGSEFVVLDAGQNLEPVTKMLVQDVKVIRVIQPGVTFDGQGHQVSDPNAAGVSGGQSGDKGQLILEVTPQQAEAISFMQDQNHDISIVVRGKDDHEIATTTGITFQILMSDGTWSMPWPKSIVAPEAKDAKK